MSFSDEPECNPIQGSADFAERINKTSIRVQVERPFCVIKQQVCSVKVKPLGPAKNAIEVKIPFGLKKRRISARMFDIRLAGAPGERDLPN
jgi:hypothetical protein